MIQLKNTKKRKALISYSKRKSGFTLVELMIIVVIIGILVAIAVPIYSGTQERAREIACQANQKTINEASYHWHLKNGDADNPYPDNVQQLKDDGFLVSVPSCAGNAFDIIDSDTGITQCPKASDKHILP